MMRTIISKMVKFSKRHLHTTVVSSREIIKPSSPTPSHLKTYNLSLFDQIAPDTYIPMVIFYPNSTLHRVKTIDMKNSLSRVLTQYYPFAGKLAKKTPYFVDCNDEGVEFLEAHNDKPLSDFLDSTPHEDLHQLFPKGLVWKKLAGYNFPETDRSSPLAVQVNHFACGGIAVAMSLSHKIADGSGLCNFFNNWAITTRLHSTEQHTNATSPINPLFIYLENENLNYQGTSLDKSRDSAVTRSFMFPNSKLNELKLKVIELTARSQQPIMNPTRTEVLNWLLYKCALKAATKNDLGSFKPTGFALMNNIRNKMIKPLPETAIGNFCTVLDYSTDTPNKITPGSFIGQLKNQMKEVQGLQDINDVIEMLQRQSLQAVIENIQTIFDDYYISTSLCRYPLYDIDFGWGKPIKITMAGTLQHNSFLAIDAKNGDGIEVFVSLGKQDMEIFQSDPELGSFRC